MFRKISTFRSKAPRDTSRLRSADPADSLGAPANSVNSSTTSTYQTSDQGVSASTLAHASSSTDGIHSRRNREAEPGPLGLNVVYTPANGHKADIVFIHGLGGTSRLTWSKNKNPELFWPLTFLPLEPDLCLARILTFGYNANFLKSGNVGTSVLDFAKGLLFDLKYAKDDVKEDLNMGNVPLIFVVHSMGGLIVKEAYMQGQNDPEYESIVKAITAIAFLATPHRGTNLAETLNRILKSAVITTSKRYISELAKNSFTLQKLNEQFRHVAPRLDIVSFYETQPTSIGLKNAKVMILEKDSSVLGYPGEISKALDADHHGVCKFESPRDPNYVAVRNVLMSLMSKIISTIKPPAPEASERKNLQSARSFLGLEELPATDYTFFRDQWLRGTCNWITQRTAFDRWLGSEDTERSTSRVLWVNGGPATGKSVLSSFVINHLVELGLSCQYHYIRLGDQTKRGLSQLLRSLAYQIAQSSQEFLRELLNLKEEAVDIESADPRTIWQRIYRSILFKAKNMQPLYWVIDGLDEAESPQAILRLFSDLPSSLPSIHAFVVSRKTQDLAAAINKIPSDIYLGEICVEGCIDDMRCYISQELTMSGTPAFKESIATRLLSGAQSNFLWIRLAVEKLNACHRLADVEAALQQLPTGMESFYERMISSLPEDPVDKALGLRILQCVVCAARTLNLTELSQALGQDSAELLDIHRSIVNLCGGFVVVDNDGNISMVHQTAREYLQNPKNNLVQIKKSVAHEELFVSCLRCMMTKGLRSKLIRASNPEFLEYAATFWSSHLVESSADSIICADALRKFFKEQAILTWIYFLASKGKLRVLALTSKNLSKFARRQDQQVERSHEMMDRVNIEAWATDLIKLIGKFGLALMKDPGCIYKEVPPLCPHSSAIYQQFGRLEGKNLQVLGICTEGWDDSLSRLPLPEGKAASSIMAAGSRAAMLVNSGSVFIYNSVTFQETTLSPISHKERIYRMELDRAATQLVTYGFKTTKVWELSSGKCKLSVNNLQSRPRPLTMLLMDHKRLLVGFDDRHVRSLDIESVDPIWETVADLEEFELDGYFLNSANYMTLSKDGSLIAVAYRGHPLSAWEVDGPVHLGHCWRTRNQIATGEVIDAVWNPQSPEVIGLYIEGVVFKWQPYNDFVEELSTGGSRLAITNHGRLFATGDARGVVKLYSTSDFSPLYQLVSQDTVFGVAFSPDARRIYDVRGSYGNVWEPNALIKHAEQTARGFEDDTDSESQGPSSTVTSSRVHRRVDAITVLSTCPTGNLYCYGTEKGMLYLHSINGGRLTNLHTSKGLLSIECLTWSQNGSLLAFTDTSKTLFILSLTLETRNTNPIVGSKLEISLRDVTQAPIRQIVIHPNSNYLIVCTETILHTILVSASSIQCSITLRSITAHWIFHPVDNGQLLGFEPRKIHRVDWRTGIIVSQNHEAAQVEEPEDSSHISSDESKVDRVLVALNKRHIIVQLSMRGLNKNTKKHIHFDVSSIPILGPDGLKDPEKIRAATLHEALSAQARDILAILPQNRLVYLSGDYSICVWKIPIWAGKASSSNSRAATTAGSVTSSQTGRQNNIQGSPVRRLFSLPSDWVGRDYLNLSAVWIAERSFLCTRNGEVAIVRCATLA